jgi:CheY-like chemotaxis protein
VADVEPVLLNALTKQLTQAQHKVRSFKSGDELLAAVDQEVPDLTLCDIKIPGKTGLETLAICENIIEARHEVIDLTNQVGAGTTVSIWLPLSQPPSVCATLARAPSRLSDDDRQTALSCHREAATH